MYSTYWKLGWKGGSRTHPNRVPSRTPIPLTDPNNPNTKTTQPNLKAIPTQLPNPLPVWVEQHTHTHTLTAHTVCPGRQPH